MSGTPPGAADAPRDLVVTALTGADPECDAFVRARPEANLCHLPAYGAMVRRAAGHDVIYLVARRGDAVRGVLPLAHVKSRLFGNFMVSHAYRNYGGPLADDDAARRALFDRAVEIARERGCQSIELRNVEPLPYDLVPRGGKVCMILPLDPDPERVWKAFDSEIRNRVRKAEKSGLAIHSGGTELVDEFHRVYSERMRELGTPCYSRGVMRAITDVFPDASRIFVVRLGEVAVGAGITTLFNGMAEIPYVATLTRYNALAPNNLVHWAAIRHYCQAGATRFDFGRCTENGPTYEFKRRWGTQRVELHYQYWVRPGHALSISAPDNPRYRRKVELWRKLPLWVTRLAGPWISRGLP